MTVKNVIMRGKAHEYMPRVKTPVNCVITDPPFGIDVAMNSAQSPEQKKINERIANDGDVQTAISVFYQEIGSVLPHLDEVADIYVFTGWQVLEWWIPAVKNLPWVQPDGECDLFKPPLYDIKYKNILIWDKGYPGKGDLEANWGGGWEPILYLKKGRRKNPYRRSGILHVDKVPSGQNIHPTEKPPQLLEILIEMSTDPGDLIVDMFSGSGSTSVAAQRLGRNSLAFEIDERFIEPSRRRLQHVGLF